MEHRDFPLKLKSVAADGTFVGYGSTYGNLDLVGDIVMPGAYNQAIQSQGKGFPLLWVHDQQTPLGIAKISDSKAGLVVDGSMLMSDPNAQRVHAFMQMGSVKGLSIGFAPPDPAKTSYDDNGNRILREITLYELSLCPIPANPKAVVTSVKSLVEVERFMQTIRAKSTPPDAEMMAHLQSIHEHVLSLMGIEDDDPDDDPDDDYLDENAAKSILAELKGLAEMATA
jgi:HK97 family phage prohead protease